MASRVGKYKLSKRDSALSLTDGGTIRGDLVFTGLSSQTATSSLAVNTVFRTGSAILSASKDTEAMRHTHFDILCIRNADGSTCGH